jgi:hypothetical protein
MVPFASRLARSSVGYALAHQFELERRTVLGEYLAVAIENQAALRRQGFDAHAVALGKFGIVVVANDLQHHEAPDEYRGECGDDEGRGQRTAFEQPLLSPVILDADRAHTR